MASSLRNLTALIVDPQNSMRASMHNMLNLCEITKIDHAVSAGTAIRPLRNKSYDLIVCEYDLGEGQDGQQLLEDLRHNKIIPLWTIFIIVTAERTYEKVVGAAELAPSDYLLKPFTAENLLERIARAVDKRAAFLPVYHLMEHGDLHEAIELCKLGEEKYRKYALDFMRLRAELHVILGEASDAEQIYQTLLQSKAVAWARLGLAKTLFMQEKFHDAEEVLRSLVEENSHYMDAYDWLARTKEAQGNLPEAKDVLQDAIAISPHAVRRLRKLGEVALEAGDVDIAERSFQRVVSRAKYSEFRDPEDHLRLVRALVRKGDVQQAATVVRDLERSLAGMEKTPACKALSAALVHALNGNEGRAAEELEAAVVACRTTLGLSNEMRMELAKNCLDRDMEAGASEVMCDVMSNASSDAALAKARRVFENAGRAHLAEEVAKESRRQVVQLVAGGAEKAKQGDYQGAVELMTAAVRRLPENPHVVFNAALANLKYIENVGWDNRLAEQARGHIETARRLDGSNPRLVPLGELYQALVRKYNVKPPVSA